MKHILSFLFLLGVGGILLNAEESSTSIKIVIEDCSLVRTGFTGSVMNLSSGVFTVHNKDFSQLKNWYIKNINSPYLSWVCGTFGYQGIVSYAKNPDFSVQTTAITKNSLRDESIRPVFPGISSSSMKNSALITTKIPLLPFFTPSASFMYYTKDPEGLHEANTLALSADFPFTFKKFSLSTSFCAFNSLREHDSSDSWYSVIPYTEKGRYFLFTNASTIQSTHFKAGVFTGMSEISKTQWKYTGCIECISKIPLSRVLFTLQGKFFICDIDFLTLTGDSIKNVIHASLNPQVLIPLNKTKNLTLSLGVLGDFQKSYTKAIPSIEETKKILKLSAGLGHSLASGEYNFHADNLFSPSFISDQTVITHKIHLTVNIGKMTKLPLKISGFIRHTDMPLAVSRNSTLCLYTSGALSFKRPQSFSMNAGTQFDISLSSKTLTACSITAEASLFELTFSGSFKQQMITKKNSFSAGLSYRFKTGE